MGLSGLDIYKQLPKLNCKECGFPTCLAFAMKLATKGVDISACPKVSDEVKAALEAASAPDSPDDHRWRQPQNFGRQ